MDEWVRVCGALKRVSDDVAGGKFMGTRKKILSLLLMIVLLLPVGMGIHVEAAAETKQVDVLFTHDTHSHLNSFSTIVDGEQKEVGGFAKIKTLIDEKK